MFTPSPFDPTFREGGVGLIVSTLWISMVVISFKVIPFTSNVATFWGTSLGGGSSMVIDLHPLVFNLP